MAARAGGLVRRAALVGCLASAFVLGPAGFVPGTVGSLLPAVAPAAAQPAAPPSAAAIAPRAAAIVHPDTVRVGEPFLLGVIARADPRATLVFPVRLELPEAVEQLAPVEVRADAGEGTWRAYYRLVAWRTGAHELPAVRIGWRSGGPDQAAAGAADGPERSVRVSAPPVAVASVLPAEAREVELRDPRPFLRYPATPWPWILAGLLLLAAAAAALWRRGRERPEPETPPEPAVPAGVRALRALHALRTRWRAGELDGAEFFDEWEAIMRRYAASTRGWPVGVPLRALADGDRPLAAAFERSTLVRFARLAAEREAPPEAAAAAIDWIRDAERAAEHPAEGPP